MSITNVGIEKGFYGTYRYDKYNNPIFIEAGKEITLQEVKRNVDTGEVFLVLEFEYMGKMEKVEVSRELLYNASLAGMLASRGADISKATFDVAVDSIRLQEGWLESKGLGCTNIFEKFGWTKLNTSQGVKPCFRSHELIGDSGTYTGDYKIAPMGKFEEWRKMVLDDVLGDTVFELVLVASLSALIVPLVVPVNDTGNPIMHIYGMSGCGKSTVLELGASVAGEPYEGDKIISENGSPKALHSIYRSWGATANALVGSCAGNMGYPIILNELGKCQEKNLTRLVYDLSEGTDKQRYSKEMKVKQSEGYKTSFLSSGEHSLLDRCKDKSDGLRVRVLEIEMTKTPNGAERADRIKAVCKKHNGHAINKMAECILNEISFKEVLALYDKNYKECMAIWTETPSYERFIAKFVALYLTTVDVALKALDIPFNKDEIRNFLFEYDQKNGKDRNSALASYDILIEIFNINQDKFVDEHWTLPKGICWGKIINEKRKTPDGRVTSSRYLVFPSVVEKLLKENGYMNMKTCVDEWKKANMIDFEDGRNTRSRKIYLDKDPMSVYAFNVFGSKVSSKILADARIKLLKEYK